MTCVRALSSLLFIFCLHFAVVAILFYNVAIHMNIVFHAARILQGYDGFLLNSYNASFFFLVFFFPMNLSWNLKIGAFLDAACRPKGSKY